MSKNTSLAHTALAFLNARVLSWQGTSYRQEEPAAATKVELGEEAAGAAAAHEEQAAATAAADRDVEGEAAAGHEGPAAAAQVEESASRKFPFFFIMR